jgi:predicted PurR-regulated permease PerM
MATTDKNKEKIKKAFSLSHPDILYLAIIIMLGISIFFTAGLIERAADVAENTNRNQKIALDSLDQINQTLITLEEQHNQIMHNNQTSNPIQSIGNLS